MDILRLLYDAVRYANVWCLLAIVDTTFVILSTRRNYIVNRGVRTAVKKTGFLIIFAAIADMISYYAYGVPGYSKIVFLCYEIVYFTPVIVPIVYCDAFDQRFIKSKTGRLVSLVALLYGISMILNIFYPIYFYIDDKSVYVQSFFWFIRPIVVVVTYFVVFSEILMKKYMMSTVEVRAINHILVLFIIGVVYSDIFYSGQIVELVLASGFSFMTSMLQNFEFKTDPVTKLANRVVYSEDALSYRDRKSLVVASVDVNDLKKINDNEGHAAGDNYLRAIALTYNKYLQKYGKMYRIGGDEFVFLGQNLNAVTEIFEKLHIQENVDMEFGDYKLSVAYGIVTKEKDETVFNAVNRADKLMYECKKAMKASAIIDDWRE